MTNSEYERRQADRENEALPSGTVGIPMLTLTAKLFIFVKMEKIIKQLSVQIFFI